MASKPTDFNDLHRLAGLAEVKRQIESAERVKESGEEVIARLAALTPLEYERQREPEAARLGCRAQILDKLVDAKRLKKPNAEQADKLQGSVLTLADVEPWPESVDGAAVLNEIAKTFSRYVILPDGAADALVPWGAHAHDFRAFPCSPRLNIRSPDKRCGKTTSRAWK